MVAVAGTSACWWNTVLGSVGSSPSVTGCLVMMVEMSEVKVKVLLNKRGTMAGRFRTSKVKIKSRLSGMRMLVGWVVIVGGCSVGGKICLLLCKKKQFYAVAARKIKKDKRYRTGLGLKRMRIEVLSVLYVATEEGEASHFD